MLINEGERAWKRSIWRAALRSWTLLRGFETGQFELRLAVRSDVTQGPSAAGPSQLIFVNSGPTTQQGT